MLRSVNMEAYRFPPTFFPEKPGLGAYISLFNGLGRLSPRGYPDPKRRPANPYPPAV
jgi:hypothetical protein